MKSAHVLSSQNPQKSYTQKQDLPNLKIHLLQEIKIGGLIRLSTVDWPEHLAAVIFLRGCPWRCGYCHNHHLWQKQAASDLSVETVFHFLQQRQGLLDGVVISGGEPLYQKQLPLFIKTIKESDFSVVLHSGGARPSLLKECLPNLSWIGLDMKTSWRQYPHLTRDPQSGRMSRQSLENILQEQIPFEVRTTLFRKFHNYETLKQMALELIEYEVKDWVWQIGRIKGVHEKFQDNFSNADQQNVQYWHQQLQQIQKETQSMIQITIRGVE